MDERTLRLLLAGLVLPIFTRAVQGKLDPNSLQIDVNVEHALNVADALIKLHDQKFPVAVDGA